ncbi:hypothetical protein N3K66_001087 [Trichothecium roseum]|uniref:Uncharacterized protein n=1 Tax=Trichothecium roseum TaxID=47278 RepID=A0ACC0VEM2_9HYPO|nr:hypothetical protein N3K66_001087 [Trichothecium roseum]
MSILKTTILSALTLTAAAIPLPLDVPHLPSLPPILPGKKNSGDITYFHPALGACGATNSDADGIVAISHLLFDEGSHCGRKMRITGAAGSVEAVVVDRCEGCDRFELDVSPSVFQASVGQLGVGRDIGSWQWM